MHSAWIVLSCGSLYPYVMRIDLTGWTLWWQTQVLGLSPEQMLREAVEARDWQRAAAIKEQTGAELEDGYVVLE